MIGHQLDHITRDYGYWTAWRFVCECGASGLPVPSQDAARVEHERHTNAAAHAAARSEA